MNNYIYIAVMAAVSYTIRVLPLTLIRKPIKNQFIQSFLYYVPYVTLAVMTFPAILYAASSPIAAFCGFIAAVFMGLKKKSLIVVALSACTVVFIVERILEMI